MATLASARPVSDARTATRSTHPAPGAEIISLADKRELAGGGPAYERAVYQPSRRAGPVAFLASAGVLLAVGAALATLNIVGEHQAASHLTVVSMKELDTTPPPPPPKTLDQPVAQPEQAFTPKPMIMLPAPGPTQVALDISPPIQPPAPVAPRIAAPVAPVATAAPAAAAGPVEGGDLSSQVISARPPVYPIDARRQKVQGTVKLAVLVGPDGRVSDLQVAVSSGSDLLDKAALKAVRQWRWTPQKQNGVAVAVRGTVPVTFALG